MATKKRATKLCEACGYPSYCGRVCKSCKKFYGTTEDAIAGSALAKRMGAAHSLEDSLAILSELVDVIVPDWPFIHGQNLHVASRADLGGLHREDSPGSINKGA